MKMKLRFEVDQAEAFRRGIDCPKSIVTVEVDPSTLSEDQRNMIADRMIGIDVQRLTVKGGGYSGFMSGRYWQEPELTQANCRIKAPEPTFEALIKAIAEDDVVSSGNLAKAQSEWKAQCKAEKLGNAKEDREKHLGKFGELKEQLKN